MILARMLHALPALWAAATLVWGFMFIIPGDPARIFAGRIGDPRVLEAVRGEWGLDRPPVERYLTWLGKVSRGDLGKSYSLRLPVAEILGRALICTSFLAVAAAIVATLVGVSLGAAAARRGGLFDGALITLTLAGISIPSFWLGLLLIVTFSSGLRWLPVSGYGEGLAIFGIHAPAFSNLMLPTVTLAAYPAALIARVTRAALLEQLSAEHVRAARARGIPASSVLWRHAFRSALAPVTTTVGLLVASLLGGAVATEIVFAWPGVGRAIFDALQRRDLPVVEGGVLLLTAIFLAVNLAVDLACASLDPRVRLGRG